MNSNRKGIDEDILHDYVDGQLDMHGRVEVARYLGVDADAKLRVDVFRRQNDALQELYDPVLREAIPKDILDVVGAVTPARVRMTTYVVVGVLFLAIACVGWLSRGILEEEQRQASQLNRFLTHAVDSYAYYGLDSDRASTAGEAIIPAWLERSLNTEIRLPSLGETGLRIAGGRLLPATTGAAGQIAFRDESGDMVGLFIQSGLRDGGSAFIGDATPEHAPGHVKRKKFSVFFWSDGTLAYAVVGRGGRATLSDAVNRIRGDLTH